MMLWLDKLQVVQIQNADELRAEIQNLGADSSLWAPTVTGAIKRSGIAPTRARFVYQEMMFEGGKVILPPQREDRTWEPGSILMVGTPLQWQHLIVRLRTQNTEELNWLTDDLERTLVAL